MTTSNFGRRITQLTQIKLCSQTRWQTVIDNTIIDIKTEATVWHDRLEHKNMPHHRFILAATCAALHRLGITLTSPSLLPNSVKNCATA
ncbi:hypothetical protein [Alteromonas hispanica]|uniref:Uncharacterized protein n=1 Tax=Alteromonas hispanica TaxID=315421 RepID=A0A6L9MWF7_9ALTE|nr:hypothetical protein [Alteromonas hispanica]NDW22161.1 hypothetical protein [Alteromonas hispanica]